MHEHYESHYRCPTEGGSTAFPTLGKSFAPAVGGAVVHIVMAYMIMAYIAMAYYGGSVGAVVPNGYITE